MKQTIYALFLSCLDVVYTLYLFTAGSDGIYVEVYPRVQEKRITSA